MDDNNIKHKTVNGFFWQLFQRIVGQLINFSVTVVLARILMPEDYGVVALAGMFILLVSSFTDTGLGVALIQKKNPDDLDYNTVFYSGFVISFFTYAVVYFLSPLFAEWYQKPEMVSIIRVVALSIPLGAISSVHNIYVKKQMIFQKLFVVSLLSSILSAIVGLTMAFKDYGVWALVGQNISASVINTIILLFVVKWTPKLLFSYSRFKTLFSFGWRMTLINIVNTFSYQLKGYVIGLKYSSADLAYYNRGEGIPGILVNNVNGSIITVLFPALSALQDDKDAVKNALRRAIRISSFFLAPLLLGLVAVSGNVVIFLYTQKWSPVIPFMQIICIISYSDIIGTANYQALVAMGKANVLMKLEFIKRPLMIGLVLVSMLISPFAIVVSMLIYSVSATMINAFPNKKFIDYSFGEQIKDISNSLLSAVLMAIIVYLFGTLNISIYYCLAGQIVIGLLSYVIISFFVNKKDVSYVIGFIKQKFGGYKW